MSAPSSYRGIEVGARVRLVHHNDPHSRLVPGRLGTFRGAHEVTGLGAPFTQLSVAWDDGSTLMLVPEDGDALEAVSG